MSNAEFYHSVYKAGVHDPEFDFDKNIKIITRLS